MTCNMVDYMATEILPNSVKTAYSYDDLDGITKLTYTKADGTILVLETYTCNIGGELSKVTREDGSYTLYEYDAAKRLSKEIIYNPSGALIESITYSYNLDGKRTRKIDAAGTHDYNYNINSQLTNVGSDQYGFDVDGRLHQFTREGKTVILDHDVFDHITQVSVNGTNTQYRYDAQGNRIGEVSANGTKNYLVAPNLGNGLYSTDLVTDGSGNVVSDYVYCGSGIIARLDANGNPIYYLTDSMGSVIGLVDSQGNRISRIIYDGFGEVKSGDDGTSLGGDFRFQGQWLETESGLYYMRARDYDAETGLFLSRDAVDVQQQSIEAFNPYQFAYNNPLIYSDPTGFFTMTEINSSLQIQGILNRVEAYAANQIKDYLIDKARGVVGDLFQSAFSSLLPSQFADIYAAFREFPNGQGPINAGRRFESAIQGAICNIIGGSYPNALWLEPAVGEDGTPNRNGYNCRNLGTGRREGNTKTNAFPDFIFKSSPPIVEPPKGWLIGDIKFSLKGVYTSAKEDSRQWKAITNYAKYKNQHEYSPIVTYTTLSKGGKQQSTYISRLQKEATIANIALFIYSVK
jgi:RHS repeat-associated protein